jgi:hypothetical protein
MDKLQRLAYVASNAVALASAIAAFNQDGHGAISYNGNNKDAGAQGISPTIGPGGFPTYMDCSGFLTYVLKKSGNMRNGSFSVSTLYGDAKSGRLAGFTVVADQDTSGMSYDEFLVLVNNGTIKPGDLVVRASLPLGENYGRGSGEGSTFKAHVLMYAGGTDPDKVVIHSTWKSSGNGPQFADIAEFKRGEKLRAVIRPPIAD